VNTFTKILYLDNKNFKKLKKEKLKMAELTYRLFMVATVAMLAGTVFLLMSSREVDPKFRRGVYISALVTGIAY